MIPKSCIIAKSVVKNCLIINCKDPSREPYAHANLIKKKDGVPTIRNSLTFPIIIDKYVKGVIEVFNKVTEDSFTEDDELYASGFGTACGSLIKSVKIYRRVREKFHIRQIMDCMLLRRSEFTVCQKMKYTVPTKIPYQRNLLLFKFNPYVMPEHEVISNVMIIFCKLNILPKFKIEEESFARFICSIIRCTPHVPFHNIIHSFNAFHFLVLLLSKCNIQRIFGLTLSEVLVLLIAALAQDMDWRGPTTPYQIIRGTSLPALYTSPGMVEKRLAISQLIRLLTVHDFNFFKHMDIEHNQICMELLHDLILATDISYHILKKPSIEKMVDDGYDRDNTKHRKLFLELLMTISQLSIFTKTWGTYKQVAVRIMKEFFREGSFRVKKKKQDYNYVEITPEKIALMHITFIDNFCCPAFNLLEKLIPRTQECYHRLLVFRAKWEKIKNVYYRRREKQIAAELASRITAEVASSSSEDY